MREVEPWVGHGAEEADVLQEGRWEGHKEGGNDGMSILGRPWRGRRGCYCLVAQELRGISFTRFPNLSECPSLGYPALLQGGLGW